MAVTLWATAVHRIRLIGALHTFAVVQVEISSEIGLQRLPILG